MKKFILNLLLLSFFLFPLTSASANHSWGGYHWARTTNPFTLKLGDNLTSAWKSFLQTTSNDWNQDKTAQGFPKVINTRIVPGSVNPKRCSAIAGTVQVCNSAYGSTGWLGIASIWLSNGHITQGTAKLNDTYYKTATYNTPAWKNLVMCQEVAHAFGLDHQDENFSNANLGSCMDYTNAPAGGLYAGVNYGANNEHPNLHDFEMLSSIYAHLDTFNSYSSSMSIPKLNTSANSELGNSEKDWGKAIKKDFSGRSNRFEKDLGKGNKVITHVFWINE